MGLALTALAAPLATLLAPAAVQAQQEPQRALESSASPFSLDGVRSLLARGDAAAASGNLAEARKYYDQARDASRRLLGFYRDLSGSFRGLDARIPREMDQKGRETLEAMAQANLRLAAVFRRQNQPEVAVPLLVEVVKVMTPVVASSVQPDICSTMPSATRTVPATGLAMVRIHVCAPDV